MKLIVLGSGTSVPLSYRASPSLALFIENGLILFDIGPGALRQMTRAGLSHQKISKIFITHFHPDHTADLIHFLFITREPSILKTRDPFVIAGPPGIKELVNNLQKAYTPWLTLPSEIMRIEELNVDNGKLEKAYDIFEITARPTKHTPNSIAYRVRDRSGKKFTYSGDSAFCEEIVDLAKGSDLLTLECSFPHEEKIEGHLTPTTAGRIASLAGIKRLLLTHFYPECLATDIAAQCRKWYKEQLILGSDLLHIYI